MNPEILMQLVYCSRNSVVGNAVTLGFEMMSILKNSRIRNMTAGITGALLFDGNIFAQVLEGPVFAVEELFEQLIFDSRHRDITLLLSGGIVLRQFPRCSMAFAGPEIVGRIHGASEMLQTAFAAPYVAATPVMKLLHRLAVEKDGPMPVGTSAEFPGFHEQLAS